MWWLAADDQLSGNVELRRSERLKLLFAIPQFLGVAVASSLVEDRRSKQVDEILKLESKRNRAQLRGRHLEVGSTAGRGVDGVCPGYPG